MASSSIISPLALLVIIAPSGKYSKVSLFIMFFVSCFAGQLIESISEIGDILRNPWTEHDIEKQEKDMMVFASSLASADTFEDPDEILWTKNAFNPELNQVDIHIYNALIKKMSW